MGSQSNLTNLIISLLKIALYVTNGKKISSEKCLTTVLGGTHICKVYGDMLPKWVGFSQKIPKHGSHFGLKIPKHGSNFQKIP